MASYIHRRAARTDERGESDVLDIRRRDVAAQIDCVAPDSVAATVARLGRSEDLAISPDGRRLVVIGINTDDILVVRPELIGPAGGRRVEIAHAETCTARGLKSPHGVTFVDDEHLIVVSREAGVSLVELPIDGRSRTLRSRILVDEFHPVPAAIPGSVEVLTVTESLVEIYVCNNHSHTVDRYLVDRSDDWAVIDARCVLQSGLDTPDGVALSPDGRWIAISNHEHESVAMHRLRPGIGPEDSPDGVLEGIGYPHGLAFVDEGRGMVVADAGRPSVLRFDAADGDWSGRRPATCTTTVMTDETFALGRYNPREGGPKGLATWGADVVVLTSEWQPLAFFELADLSGGAASRCAHDDGPDRGERLADGAAERLIVDLAHRLVTVGDAQRSLLTGVRWRIRSALRRVKIAGRRTHRRITGDL